ncbi:ferritin [Massilia sp. TS11]|uniref:ferritin family protein n=1 Tax=Massilia sp. TS11 TaxID=2908003 RepID=UPI001EDAE5EB|nr:ferritin [Massilia sp. TS11]MCG2583278.1 ferritin [Massilia sp. TS11]
MAHQEYHEDAEALPAPTRDMHRALQSLRAELDAVDSYSQRFEACTDPELKRVLAHLREAKKEHAAMLMEWIRRRDVPFATRMKDSLFKAGPITAQYRDDEDTPAE